MSEDLSCSPCPAVWLGYQHWRWWPINGLQLCVPLQRRWWAGTRSGVQGGYSGSFGERPNSSRQVLKMPTHTKHSRSISKWLEATEGCSAALGSVHAHVMYLPWSHRSHRRSLTMFYYRIRIRQPVRPTLSVSSQSLSLIIPTSICSIEHNLTLLLGYPSHTFTISFFPLALQHLFLLSTLGWQIPNIQDFVTTNRLLPYHLQNPYGHFTYLLIFAVRYVLAPIWDLPSFLAWYFT